MNILLIALFLICLLYHTYTDLKEMLIYDWVNLIILVGGLMHAYINDMLLEAGLGFGIALVILLVIYFVSRGGLGEGDVKLAPCLGLWLGFEKTLLGLLLAFVLGAVIGLIYMYIKGREFKTAIPFGPFLCLGACISFFFGKELIAFYFSLL